jgi:hypothetical protein
MTKTYDSDEVFEGWAVQIFKDDKTTFLANGSLGIYPIVYGKNQRKSAVAYKKELIEHGFKCRVVKVEWSLPVVCEW